MNGAFPAGQQYSVSWDAKDDAGHWVSAGIYFYRININNQFIQTNKMILIK